jgi:glycosyltransferase involved in cell wall biosynthesis
MKILQVTPYFPPAYAFGGPVKVAYQISRELIKRGHEVVVYTTNAKDFGSKLETDSSNIIEGMRVHRFRNLSLTLVKKLKLFITPQLALFARKEVKKFDIIHLHEYRTFQNIVIHHYARRYDVSYVLQAHGSLPRAYSWQKLKWLYDELFGYKLLRDVSKVIALTQVEAEQYKRMGVPEEKIAIIPNGIDLSEYAELPPKGSFRKKFNIPEDRKIILYLGRIHRTKGIDFLIRAYAILKNKMNFKDAVLVIAGPDDGYLNEAKALANRLGILNSTVLTGFISSEYKLSALVDADVFVTPSFYGFPMAFLEACAVGTSIVTTSLGDTLEWVDGNVGYVAQPTPSDLAEAIYRIISDDELRKKFSRNCIEIVKSEFSIERVVEMLENVYEEALKVKASDNLL